MLKSAFALAAILVLASAAPPPVGPVPQPKPAQETTAVPTPEEKPEAAEKESPSTEREPEDPAALAACVKALEENGAVFRMTEEKSGPGACGIENPVELLEPAPGVRLDPPALLRCDAALKLTEWTRDMALPAAKKAFPDKRLTGFSNASSYVCRNRNSAETGKVSEHASGNAIDISAVTFSGGVSLPMKPRVEDGDMEGAFQRSLTASACLYFTTVLSPGSDATHQDHLHLDALQRKNDYRYCR